MPRSAPLSALLTCLVASWASGCSCEPECERPLGRFEAGLAEREAELARFLEGSAPVRLGLEGGKEPPPRPRRVLVTGEGIHRERITCVTGTYANDRDKWLRHCRKQGEWAFRLPRGPQPVGSLDAIGDFVRAPADLKSLCVPQGTVVYVGRDADVADFAAVLDAWPRSTLDMLAETPEGMRAFTAGAASVYTPGEHRARRAAEKASPPETLRLTVDLASGGAIIGGSGGTLASGCEDTRLPDGQTPTVPKHDGRHDARRVRACLEKVKLEFPGDERVTIRAAGVALADVVAVLAAVTTTAEGRELFPDVELVTDK